ncbi:hypothetical protein [Nocardioides okcheonensis]|uniref:hypothetical protein n=1 Tax=Nocardioides okcheonensis TaxID=2894081 RepID=UPI001E58F2DF|nr:hypothetical protein [Nocardioides okcheonensis]UFN44572.1 hypothetical protein LN652_21445 [Nocardioides okcheonensis]
MIHVPAIEMVGWLVLGLMVLRAAWLAAHPALHHAALRPARWSAEVDRRVLRSHSPQHRA